jgi:hypothetical protein
MSEKDRKIRTRLAELVADEAGLGLPAHRRMAAIQAGLSGASARRLAFSRAAGTERGAAPLHVPAYAWVGAMAIAVLVVGGGYLWQPGAGEVTAPTLVAQDRVQLTVSQQGSDVILEWGDGGRRSYTLKQAQSARDVRNAPGIPVSGHRYVDRSPSDAHITYYLVE